MQGIGAVAGNHHTTNGLRTTFVQSSPSCGRTIADFGNILQTDGDMIPDRNHTFLQVLQVLDISQGPYQVFGPVNLNGPGPDIQVTVLYRRHYLGDVQSMRFHGIGINIHLVFFYKTTDGCNLSNSFG